MTCLPKRQLGGRDIGLLNVILVRDILVGRALFLV